MAAPLKIENCSICVFGMSAPLILFCLRPQTTTAVFELPLPSHHTMFVRFFCFWPLSSGFVLSPDLPPIIIIAYALRLICKRCMFSLSRSHQLTTALYPSRSLSRSVLGIGFGFPRAAASSNDGSGVVTKWEMKNNSVEIVENWRVRSFSLQFRRTAAAGSYL